MTTVHAELSQAGIRATPNRVAVLTLFRDHPHEHFSADQIYRRLAANTGSLSLASVYRSLTYLLDAALITSASLGNSRVIYELNRGEPHYHLVCNRCGVVRDAYDSTLKAACQSIAVEQDFTYAAASVVIFGECSDCRQKATRSVS
ncbi:Fur family transcriptional regulator [Paraburkholderia sp. BCC1885]|uniref:Fur family transcriptional regulator n=1 Tax=Paraburkholderia sp. BCC1885 TaxID=2562669 RepID=UPI0011821A33|nr:Fur family transcriptional regulator [Paraburkholderia sp. BCC1885]